MNEQQAEEGVRLIKEAILQLLNKNPGLKSSEIARSLSLESESPDGSQKGWLCYGFLQNLLCEQKIKKNDLRYYTNNE